MSTATPAAAGADPAFAADQAFFGALLAGDTGKLDELLAPEFLIVDVATGGVTDRAGFLEFVGSGQVRFAEIQPYAGETVVRCIGDVVIVVGRTRMTFSMPDATTVQVGSRYTHVFSAAAGRWQLVSAQGTQLREAA